MSVRLGCAVATQGQPREADGHVGGSTGQYYDAPLTWAAVSVPVQLPQVESGDDNQDGE